MAATGGHWVKGAGGSRFAGGVQSLPRAPADRRGKRKVEIAPYTWEDEPKGMRSIWGYVAGIFARYNRDSGQLEYAASPQTLGDYRMTEAKARDLVARWNRGERGVAREPVTTEGEK